MSMGGWELTYHAHSLVAVIPASSIQCPSYSTYRTSCGLCGCGCCWCCRSGSKKLLLCFRSLITHQLLPLL